MGLPDRLTRSWKSTQKLIRWVAVSALLLLVLAPPVLYVVTFGPSLSENHARWGEFGSAMAGIYSPLIAAIAVVVLVGQVHSQNKAAELQLDYQLIAQSRSDLEFYLARIEAALEHRHESGRTIRQVLAANFEADPKVDLTSDQMLALARDLNRDHPQPFDTWGAIYSILMGLRAPTQFPYNHSASAASHKVSVTLTLATCIALDNFHCCLSRGRSSAHYEYSRDVVARTS